MEGKILSGGIEEQLQLMREGRDAPLEFKIGGALIRCRLLSGDEQVRIGQAIQVKRFELPDDQPPTDQWQQHEIRKAFLLAATTIPGQAAPDLHSKLLSAMTNDEVLSCYRSYTELLYQVSPMFELLTDEDYKALVDEVKKNPASLNDFTTAQYVGMLARVLDVDLEALRAGRSFG